MSRLTGTDAYSLMEAYQAVYAPQELTEEQVWEEVETWVNDLIEEGYDLSDYTWEEMYEAYIEELTNPINDLWNNRGRIAGAANRAYSGTMRGADAAVNQLGTSATNTAKAVKGAVTSPRVAAAVSGFNAGGLVPAISGALRVPAPAPAPAPAPRQKPAPAPTRTPASDLKAGTRDLLNRTPAPTRTPAPAPAPATARPAAPTPTNRPVTTAPASPKPAAPAGGSALDRATAAASTPAAFSPKPQSDVGKMIDASKARQAAQTPKPATPAPARPMGSARERMLQRQSFDVFDVIKGHLIDEGYADTEESALVIMANMSEEWRESIVENLLPSKQQIANRSSLATAKHKTSATASMERMNSRTSAPKPDMSTPKDREIGRRISQTPIGVRLTGPTGPLR